MKASFVDLRTKSGEIMRALSRNERVTLFYRGTPVAVMVPIGDAGESAVASAKDHPAFGLWSDRGEIQDVASHVRELRKGRFGDL